MAFDPTKASPYHLRVPKQELPQQDAGFDFVPYYTEVRQNSAMPPLGSAYWPPDHTECVKELNKYKELAIFLQGKLREYEEIFGGDPTD